MNKHIKTIEAPLNITSEEDYIKRNPKMFVVRSHIAQQFNKLGCRMAFETLDRINYMVARLIKDSVRRCKENNRNTILPRDI